MIKIRGGRGSKNIDSSNVCTSVACQFYRFVSTLKFPSDKLFLTILQCSDLKQFHFPVSYLLVFYIRSYQNHVVAEGTCLVEEHLKCSSSFLLKLTTSYLREEIQGEPMMTKKHQKQRFENQYMLVGRNIIFVAIVYYSNFLAK